MDRERTLDEWILQMANGKESHEDLIKQIRNEAYEKAAKVCEALKGRECASAIRRFGYK